MPIFLWKKSYEIGIAEIDNQHRNLVGIINELSDAMMNRKGYIIVPKILEKLVDYIQFHFTTEEEIMRETKEVLNFLCDWLKEHIVVSDKKLRAHIQRMDG
jgi:hemerythrin